MTTFEQDEVVVAEDDGALAPTIHRLILSEVAA
jgi:hypothetical protein